MTHGVNPDSRSARKVFEAARRHGIPVMVHTGSGVPFADPMSLFKITKEYADVKIVMAHSGMLVFSGNAAKLIDERPNLYGDSTWTPGFLVKNWTMAYGPRIMFASDHADNTAPEIEKIITCGLVEEDQRQIFAATAVAVFNLKQRRTS